LIFILYYTQETYFNLLGIKTAIFLIYTVWQN